ncbi:YcbK family protein [Paracoccaceae bacterium GXU_MW_L88]
MTNQTMTRRGVLGAMAAFTVAAPVYANAPGLLRGAGQFRQLRMTNARTGEALNTHYWVEGQYIEPALNEIHYFFRDWRQNLIARHDRRSFDIISITHQLLNTQEPMNLVSGFRSVQTNNMLDSRIDGVAQNSYHTRGMAADLTMRSRSVRHMVSAASSLQAGGVGTYTRSNFIHIDSGPKRYWGS